MGKRPMSPPCFISSIDFGKHNNTNINYPCVNITNIFWNRQISNISNRYYNCQKVAKSKVLMTGYGANGTIFIALRSAVVDNSNITIILYYIHMELKL